MLKVAAFSLLVLCVHSAPVPADKAEKISHVALEKPEFVVIHMSAPKFLEDATPEGRKKFAEIILGAGKEDKTIQQIFDALNEWAKAQGPQVEAAYGKTKDKVKAAVADVRTAIAKSKLSDAAKQGFAKIGAVLSNRDQTQTQVYTKVHEILEALPKGVKKEMNEYTESVAEEALLKLKAQVATGSA